jgi:NDP-sugar pyrophosphorylase family protein
MDDIMDEESVDISEDIMDDASIGAEDIIEEDASIGAEDIIEDDASIGAEDIIEDEASIGAEDIIEDDASMGADDIMEESIEDMVESIDEDASCAITGSARMAATAVVARRVRIIVSSLGSTCLDGPRGALPGWVRHRAVFGPPTWTPPSCSAAFGFPSILPRGNRGT